MFNAFVLEHIYLKYAPQKRTTQIMRMKQLIETIIIGRITLKSLSSIVFIEKEYLKRYQRATLRSIPVKIRITM